MKLTGEWTSKAGELRREYKAEAGDIVVAKYDKARHFEPMGNMRYHKYIIGVEHEGEAKTIKLTATQFKNLEEAGSLEGKTIKFTAYTSKGGMSCVGVKVEQEVLVAPTLTLSTPGVPGTPVVLTELEQTFVPQVAQWIRDAVPQDQIDATLDAQNLSANVKAEILRQARE